MPGRAGEPGCAPPPVRGASVAALAAKVQVNVHRRVEGRVARVQ